MIKSAYHAILQKPMDGSLLKQDLLERVQHYLAAQTRWNAHLCDTDSDWASFDEWRGAEGLSPTQEYSAERGKFIVIYNAAVREPVKDTEQPDWSSFKLQKCKKIMSEPYFFFFFNLRANIHKVTFSNLKKDNRYKISYITYK